MFETYDHAEVPVLKQLSLNGERLWQYVQLHIHIPWLYVEYAVSYEDGKFKSILFLTDNDQLQSLVDRSDVEITQAHVVTPGYVNQTNVWKMDQLKKVMTANIKCGGELEPVTIYELLDGQKIIYGSNGVTDEKPINIKTVFSSSSN
ncbi:MAG: hypothetical protein ACKVN9_06155 [Methylophilaceae bacterium]